jgi:hypothetical protein
MPLVPMNHQVCTERVVVFIDFIAIRRHTKIPGQPLDELLPSVVKGGLLQSFGHGGPGTRQTLHAHLDISLVNQCYSCRNKFSYKVLLKKDKIFLFVM